MYEEIGSVEIKVENTAVGRRIVASWTGDGSSPYRAVKFLNERITGRIRSLHTQPIQCDATYSVELLDEFSCDLLLGLGATRSASASEIQPIYATDAANRVTTSGVIQLAVTGGSASDSGVVVIYFDPPGMPIYEPWPSAQGVYLGA